MIQQRARATRESILAGAAAVFEKQGYGNASLASVAERASVTKGALYFHFRSKDELARAVIAAQHAFVMERSAAILAEGRPPLESMILMCREFGRDLIAEPIVRAGVRLTFEATAFGQDIAGPYRDWVETVERLTRAARDEGWLHADVDPESFARLLVGSFTGVQMVSDILTGRRDVLERIEDMWAALLPGILSEGRRPEGRRLAGLISGDPTQ
ncbi:ScbR family autoregulator-binding transcription factor [Arthrobacter sp. TMN-37]